MSHVWRFGATPMVAAHAYRRITWGWARGCCFKLKRLGNDNGAGFPMFGHSECEDTGAEGPDSGGAVGKAGDKQAAHSVGFGEWFRDGAKCTAAPAR